MDEHACSPHDRDWENSQQRCDFCESHDLLCGPNVRYNEDPAVIQRLAVVPEHANALGSNQARESHLEGSTTLSAPNVPTPTVRRTRGRNEGLPNARRVADGRVPSAAPSIEDIEGRAFSKLHDFHALGNTLAYVSQHTFVYCRIHVAQRPYHDLSIEEKLHDLFINIYGIAVEANARNEAHLARWILFELLSALDQYRLCDKRKRHILLKIARMFQELGHRWSCEHVLLKISGMYKGSALPPQEDPFHLLANSFPTSSVSIRRVLGDRWNETVGGNHVDLDLNVPPLHAAVQHRNPSIILALLSNPNDRSYLPLAPSLTTLSNVGQVRVNIEERDLDSRTALFAAVIKGDESCCSALLLHGADANTRDDHGHTALEVAVRGGYLNIVKNLINCNAHVNPDITGCSSLPLHAAIESDDFQLEIIGHLLNSGAAVQLRRYADNKHAIDLAVDREYHELAESMRRMIPSVNRTPFMTRDFSTGQIIS
ncbi:MAG: hypothetical protein ASARMPREDX12_003892 [Alectoria sarmentosa]|nr:MAG: hypothetical protein ASARMPREDX12_003892 [Alectoria sarmentosa]